MPSRTPVSEETTRRILEAHAELKNGRAVARKLGIHEGTVYVVLRRNRGTCVRCNREVVAGRKHCADCLTFLREDRRARRKERRRAGLCEMCDNPIQQPSRKFCAEHRVNDLEYHAHRYHEQKEKRGHWQDGVPNVRQRRRYIQAKYGRAGLNVLDRDQDKCVICGISHAERAVHIHHINGSHGNSTEENMVCLCFYCHKMTHLLIEHPQPMKALQWIRDTYPDIIDFFVAEIAI